MEDRKLVFVVQSRSWQLLRSNGPSEIGFEFSSEVREAFERFRGNIEAVPRDAWKNISASKERIADVYDIYYYL